MGILDATEVRKSAVCSIHNFGQVPFSSFMFPSKKYQVYPHGLLQNRLLNILYSTLQIQHLLLNLFQIVSHEWHIILNDLFHSQKRKMSQ